MWVPVPATLVLGRLQTCVWTRVLSSQRLSPKGILNPNSNRARARAAASFSQVSTKRMAPSLTGIITASRLSLALLVGPIMSGLPVTREEVSTSKTCGGYWRQLYRLGSCRFATRTRHPRRCRSSGEPAAGKRVLPDLLVFLAAFFIYSKPFSSRPGLQPGDAPSK